MNFPAKIKELRENKELLQRQLAASLEIDTPMYSKIERGERKAKREQVLILAKLLDADINELLTLWISDKIIDHFGKEPVCIEALRHAAIEIKKKSNS